MLYLFIALAPIIIILFYIYFRDKYEKEPIKILLITFAVGALTVIPIIIIEKLLMNFWEMKFSASVPKMSSAAYSAFIVAAFTEELFKFLAFFILIWRNKNFDERFDGIVYAVFISLGFAAVENVLYVIGNGLPTGLLRAFTAVPAHALFGVSMGYFLGLAKFSKNKKGLYILLSITIPILLHGFYNFILMSQNNFLLLLFIPFLIFMLIVGLKKMKRHSNDSVFKNNPKVK